VPAGHDVFVLPLQKYPASQSKGIIVSAGQNFPTGHVNH